MENKIDELGIPDLKLAGLQIWVHKRQFPDADDYWDANRINVTVHCEARGSNVWVQGNIIHLSEISQFLSGVGNIKGDLKGKAELACMEPQLYLKLEAKNLGHIEMEVDLTPDHLSQQHKFTFEIDQSYLPSVITECKKILEQYPIKGRP